MCEVFENAEDFSVICDIAVNCPFLHFQKSITAMVSAMLHDRGASADLVASCPRLVVQITSRLALVSREVAIQIIQINEWRIISGSVILGEVTCTGKKTRLQNKFNYFFQCTKSCTLSCFVIQLFDRVNLLLSHLFVYIY